MVRKNYFFIFLFLLILGFFGIGFFTGNQQTKDVIEKIGGTVSFIDSEEERVVLYLDVSPDYDNNKDGLVENDKDVWVSAFDEEILNTLAGLEVGDYIYAKDLWKADESLENGINHYYILEFYEIRRK